MEKTSQPLSIAPQILDALPKDAIVDLGDILSRLRLWTDSLPSESYVLLNRAVPLRPPGVPRIQDNKSVFVADAFMDVHTHLTGLLLAESWRVAQLAAGLTTALSNWNLTLAAMVARTALETAAAWAIESAKLLDEWAAVKGTSLTDPRDVIERRRRLFLALQQPYFGTRRGDMLENYPSLRRTNIGTFLKKAAAAFGYGTLLNDYEVLCDAVHPSWGALECFWAEVGGAEDIPQFRTLLSRSSVGHFAAKEGDLVRPGSPLAPVILTSCRWAFRRLEEDLANFDRMCRDVCLTTGIYIFPNMTYWGIVKPTGTYSQCSCGSGRKSRFCRHTFGNR